MARVSWLTSGWVIELSAPEAVDTSIADGSVGHLWQLWRWGCTVGERLVGGRLVGGRLVGGRLVGGRLVGGGLVGGRLVVGSLVQD